MKKMQALFVMILLVGSSAAPLQALSKGDAQYLLGMGAASAASFGLSGGSYLGGRKVAKVLGEHLRKRNEVINKLKDDPDNKELKKQLAHHKKKIMLFSTIGTWLLMQTGSFALLGGGLFAAPFVGLNNLL